MNKKTLAASIIMIVVIATIIISFGLLYYPILSQNPTPTTIRPESSLEITEIHCESRSPYINITVHNRNLTETVIAKTYVLDTYYEEATREISEWSLWNEIGPQRHLNVILDFAWQSNEHYVFVIENYYPKNSAIMAKDVNRDFYAPIKPITNMTINIPEAIPNATKADAKMTFPYSVHYNYPTQALPFNITFPTTDLWDGDRVTLTVTYYKNYDPNVTEILDTKDFIVIIRK